MINSKAEIQWREASVQDARWREAVVAEAQSWAGVKYLHQGSDKVSGCDCIGLVRGIWRNLLGPEPEAIPGYSGDWAEIDGHETLLEAGSKHFQSVELDQVKSGHILVFRWRPHLPAKHCGILITPDRMVHAYESAGIVAASNIAHWRSKIVAAFAFPQPIKARK